MVVVIVVLLITCLGIFLFFDNKSRNSEDVVINEEEIKPDSMQVATLQSEPTNLQANDIRTTKVDSLTKNLNIDTKQSVAKEEEVLPEQIKTPSVVSNENLTIEVSEVSPVVNIVSNDQSSQEVEKELVIQKDQPTTAVIFKNTIQGETIQYYYNVRMDNITAANPVEKQTNSENPILSNHFPPDFNDIDESDDSIINVSSSTFNTGIPPDKDSLQYVRRPLPVTVPYWRHQYVYSVDEIKSADTAQKEFYAYYKKNFLEGNYFDLQGNSNYAFILLFDLLKDYSNHTIISLLEEQLELLGFHYPVTNSYAVRFLIKKYEELGDWQNIARIRTQQSYNAGYSFIPDWQLGTKYKNKLNLTDEEVSTLNHFSYDSNVFSSIEFCCKNIIKLFLKTIKVLQTIKSGSNGNDILTELTNQISSKHYKNSYNSGYYATSILGEIYLNIFKNCENAVRDLYGHKRNINTDVYYTAEIKGLYESAIVLNLQEILPNIISTLDKPDEATDIELNRQNTTRWKTEFESIKESYNGNSDEFVKQTINLARRNAKNLSLENIYFESSKFIAKYNVQAALTLYIYYLHTDLLSATFDNKKLTKTIQKNLFKTNEQLHQFESIISQLISDKDLSKALSQVSNFYSPKRKKITLSNKSISEVQEQHSKTVQVLNEYLQDEFEDAANVITSKEISEDEIEIKIVSKGPVDTIVPTYILTLHQNELHVQTLDLFAKNNYSILQSEVEDFARNKGVFKNQLIESINDTCYDCIDDILIEEEDAFYTINPSYFNRILFK